MGKDAKFCGFCGNALTKEDLTSHAQKYVIQEASSPIIEQETDIKKATVREIRPWVRYFARNIDYLIAGLTFGFMMGLFFGPNALDGVPDLASGMFIIFIWIFIEAILLSSWGTTPGKWLFKTTIRTENGEKPNFSSAIGRSFSVWLKGYAIGIPFISLITLLMAYDKLTKDHNNYLGQRSWVSGVT
ncbi:MAG: RDD family protein [Candidatus Methanoperedens sp.]|nr:RDD family protein [Candidatus Methanoperedens sp.]